jgi:hypothetical protein
MGKNHVLAYTEREQRLSPGARSLMDATWAILAKRVRPDMPAAEAIASFKESHALGLVELVEEGEGLALRVV